MGADPVFILFRLEGRTPANYPSHMPIEDALPDDVHVLVVRELRSTLANAVTSSMKQRDTSGANPRILRVPVKSRACHAVDATIFGSGTKSDAGPMSFRGSDAEGWANIRPGFPFESRVSRVQLRPVRQKARPGSSRGEDHFRMMRAQHVGAAISSISTEAIEKGCDVISMVLPPLEFEAATRQLLPPSAARALGRSISGPLDGCAIENGHAKPFLMSRYIERAEPRFDQAQLRQTDRVAGSIACDCKPAELLQLRRPCACASKRDVA